MHWIVLFFAGLFEIAWAVGLKYTELPCAMKSDIPVNPGCGLGRWTRERVAQGGHRVAASALLLLLLAAPAPTPAIDLRRVGELRLGSGGLTEWLDPRGYVRLKNEWERTPTGERRVTFVVADVREQRLLRLPFDLEAFRRSHPALFTGLPNVELVHFDGTTGLLRFDRREPLRTTAFYATWDPRTQAVGEPRPLGEVAFTEAGGKRQVSRVGYLVGPDPAANRLYFADATYDVPPEPREGPSPGPSRIRFFRVTLPDLEQDWELELELPRRSRRLPAETYRAFSPDGRWFALAEYYDRAAKRESPAVPPPQVYVLDLARRTVARYPIPSTPYGLAFSRDGRYLAVGSHEEAVIVRIDLEAGRIDRKVKAQTHIQGFATTASGESLLVMSDHIGAPRSIEVRRWSDLGLQQTIAPSRLFPGIAGIHPSGIRATADGRLLVAPRYKADGYPDSSDAGLVTFAVDEAAGEAAAEARPASDPTALVRPHVERAGVKLYAWQMGRVGNEEGYFAPIVGNARGEAFVIGTRSDLRADAPYQPGESHPYAIWVGADGKVLWERSLRSGKRFVDYQGGTAVATPDGAFIAFVLCYVSPGSGASTRIVKLDRKGRVLWEWMSPVGKEARFPDELRLLDSGRVLMKGHLGTSRTPWEGELDAATGRLLRDDVGPAP